MERSLASEILRQAKKEAKVLSTHGAFCSEDELLLLKRVTECVCIQANTMAPSGLCSFLPSLQGEAHYTVQTPFL